MSRQNHLILILFCSSLLLGGMQTRAEDHVKYAQAQVASVTITTPENGAKLNTDNPITLSYTVTPGPVGDHVHVYVDGSEVGILRQLQGNFIIDPLPRGRHVLAIKIVNKDHVPIGVESSISIDVE
ncbi:MAG: Ig-like domain-containing protein [Chromatiales bacterium]|jgi:hypothetical protein